MAVYKGSSYTIFSQAKLSAEMLRFVESGLSKRLIHKQKWED